MSSNGRVWRVGVGISSNIIYAREVYSFLSLSFERSHAAAATRFVEDQGSLRATSRCFSRR